MNFLHAKNIIHRDIKGKSANEYAICELNLGYGEQIKQDSGVELEILNQGPPDFKSSTLNVCNVSGALVCQFDINGIAS